MLSENERPMSTADWFLTLLILAIPVVNIVMIIVWGVGTGNVNRVAYCRAILLFVAIFIVFAVLWRLAGWPMMPFYPDTM